MHNKLNDVQRKVNGAIRMSRDTGIDVGIAYFILDALLKEYCGKSPADSE